ncbi:MAG: DUF3098 domain-containing protein [Weeksellaceae bacterium]|nr:DUF3098 domain-containing protein [Weeksellaceae bacterium]
MNANQPFLFHRKNYYFMAVGLFLIALGFFLMTGHDANTMPDGTHNPNYWNEDIFSWRRIRLAPFLVLAGFGVTIFAIMKNFSVPKV